MPARTRKAARTSKAESFYERILDEAERSSLAHALEVEGVDQELAMLRLRLRALLEQESFDFSLMLRAVESVRRLVATRYRLTPEQSQAFSDEAPALREELMKMFAEVRNDGDAGSD